MEINANIIDELRKHTNLLREILKTLADNHAEHLIAREKDRQFVIELREQDRQIALNRHKQTAETVQSEQSEPQTADDWLVSRIQYWPADDWDGLVSFVNENYNHNCGSIDRKGNLILCSAGNSPHNAKLLEALRTSVRYWHHWVASSVLGSHWFMLNSNADPHKIRALEVTIKCSE